MLGLIWASAWATKTNWQSGLIFMMLLMILVIEFDGDDDAADDDSDNALQCIAMWWMLMKMPMVMIDSYDGDLLRKG